ncbi:hypothetical protein Tco_1381969 [Tanacetum coccineum]
MQCCNSRINGSPAGMSSGKILENSSTSGITFAGSAPGVGFSSTTTKLKTCVEDWCFASPTKSPFVNGAACYGSSRGAMDAPKECGTHPLE